MLLKRAGRKGPRTNNPHAYAWLGAMQPRDRPVGLGPGDVVRMPRPRGSVFHEMKVETTIVQKEDDTEEFDSTTVELLKTAVAEFAQKGGNAASLLPPTTAGAERGAAAAATAGTTRSAATQGIRHRPQDAQDVLAPPNERPLVPMPPRVPPHVRQSREGAFAAFEECMAPASDASWLEEMLRVAKKRPRDESWDDHGRGYSGKNARATRRAATAATVGTTRGAAPAATARATRSAPTGATAGTRRGAAPAAMARTTRSVATAATAGTTRSAAPAATAGATKGRGSSGDGWDDKTRDCNGDG